MIRCYLHAAMFQRSHDPACSCIPYQCGHVQVSGMSTVLRMHLRQQQHSINCLMEQCNMRHSLCHTLS